METLAIKGPIDRDPATTVVSAGSIEIQYVLCVQYEMLDLEFVSGWAR